MTNAEIEPTYKIVGAVFRQAVRDTCAGCPEAQEWLRCVAPDEYERLLDKERRRLRKRDNVPGAVATVVNG